MNFVANEPKENATLDQAHALAKQYVAAGLSPTIYANPTSANPSPDGGMIAEKDFAANGVPTAPEVPLFLSFQFPGNSKYTDNYTVGLIIIAMKSGKSLTEALS